MVTGVGVAVNAAISFRALSQKTAKPRIDQPRGHEPEGKIAKMIILMQSNANAQYTLKVNVSYFGFVYAVHVPWYPACVAVSHKYALAYRRQTHILQYSVCCCR